MIRFAAVSALALLSLAACERTNDPVAAPPPVAVNPPQETASPAPAADVLTGEGLNAVRIGMTRAEVVGQWGEDSAPDAVGGSDPAACDEFHPVKAPTGVNVMIQNGVLTRITLMRDAAIKTDRGFGVGDSSMAIKEAYGGAIFAQPHKYQPAPAENLFAWSHRGSSAYVTDAAARGVRYEVGTEGKVTLVHAGDPSIQLVEGCS